MAITAFEKAASRVPTEIGTINIFLRATPVEGGPVQYGANYEVEILDQDGKRIDANGDNGNLIPHLTQDQATWLVQFMTDMRALATSGFIG